MSSAHRASWRRWAASALVATALLIPLPVAATTSAQGDHAALRQRLIKAMSEHAGFKDRFSAQVWLLYMSSQLSPFVPQLKTRLRLLRAVHREAKLAGLSPSLVLAVIQVESRFNPRAVSVAGARGLMQVMPFWLREIGYPKDNLFNVDTNLRLGCNILKFYIDKSHDDLYEALARYNGSTGRAGYARRVLHALHQRWAYH